MTSNRTFLGALALSTGMLFLTTGQVSAQGQSALAGALLEEVIVTARRREENLMELPLSIQAISAEAMQAQGIYNIKEITDFVPNVALVDVARHNDSRVFIRGIGGGFSNPSNIFGTKIFVDGHLVTGTNGNFYSTADVERVEVLRGPQGTLFGSNTTGGLVNIITAKPGPDFESEVTLRAADFGEQGLRAMVNFPLSDSVFARVNYSNESSDGYYTNDFIGGDEGGEDAETISVAVRFTPGNWTIDARLWMAEDRDDNRGGACQEYPSEGLVTAINDAGFAYTGPGPGPGGSYADGFGAWGAPRDFFSDAADRRPPGPPTDHAPGNFLNFVDGPSTIFDHLVECGQMQAAGDFHTRSNIDSFSYVDNDSFNIDATWTPTARSGRSTRRPCRSGRGPGRITIAIRRTWITRRWRSCNSATR